MQKIKKRTLVLAYLELAVYGMMMIAVTGMIAVALYALWR